MKQTSFFPEPPKAAYVRTEAAKGHDGAHTCHAEGCDKKIPPALLMCKPHWALVPKVLQTRIWRHFRPGQENDKRPTREYVEALHACVVAVREAEGRR